MTYPIVFAPSVDKIAPARPEAPSKRPEFKIHLLPKAGHECHRFRLAEIRGWPETKVEMEQQCVTIFGHRICTDIPRLYHRSCTLYAYVDVCYPAGGLNDVETCILGAALAGAVAAVISGGAAAGPAFKSALEACLLAKGVAWASDITVNAGSDTDCVPWHPV
ncbi:MAG: hypothetical protein EKK41_01340 [Hyphomicrobiales bacterium]|nr:MAG: hypothetical protein EKK41_01340 [Hyphomicrobiales bacterium]